MCTISLTHTPFQAGLYAKPPHLAMYFNLCTRSGNEYWEDFLEIPDGLTRYKDPDAAGFAPKTGTAEFSLK